MNDIVEQLRKSAQFNLDAALAIERLRRQRDEYDVALRMIATAGVTDPSSFARGQLAPCGECHIQPGERCDICGKIGASP